jgi:outer membrane receptor protein involved in Fe transport
MGGRHQVAGLTFSAILATLFSSPSQSQEALPTIEVGARTRARPASTVVSAPEGPVAQPSPTSEPSAGVSPVLSQPKAPDEAASVKTFTGAEVNAVPFYRPGEALEVVPGLVVSQHSGEGKANQYNLRGFQLDHGTDLALWLDGMPLNMRTHGHGQGYADANFLIPELLSSVVVRKGPYFADEGDFSSAGSVHMQYIDKLDQGLFSATGGMYGYWRLLSIKSYEVNDGNLLTAVESNVFNGPWTRPDEQRKINGVMRWSRGTQEDGVSITGMAYANRWYSTDQIPERAVQAGFLPLYGQIDRTDGGDTTRFSLSTRWSQTEGNQSSRVEAYVIRSTLDLYNNFTYFLANPTLGDQFHQFDHRTLFGVNAVHGIKHELFGYPVESRIGFQGRFDNIRVGLQDTYLRQPYDAIRNDYVNEGGFSFWTDHTVFWTPWLRTTAGFRFDYLHADVNGLQTLLDAPKVFDSNGFPAAVWTAPFNSGSKGAAITSPKFGAVIGPYNNTELFLNYGEGFHSTDSRGTVQYFDAAGLSDNDTLAQVGRIPLLVKSRGAEIGARTKIIEGLDTSVALWWLNFDSENQFEGDTGTTTFGRPSRRYGIEITNHYSPNSWLRFDGDVALVHARFRGFDTQQAIAYMDLLNPQSFPYGTYIGNAPGNFIPEAKGVVATIGLELGEKTGWFGALKYRYFGSQPLTEDGALKGPATGVVNARVGYRWDNGWSLRADVFNLFNTRSDQITYGYGSLLPTDPLFTLCQAGAAPGNVCAIGVMDRHFHPVEPATVRVTLSGPLPF